MVLFGLSLYILPRYAPACQRTQATTAFDVCYRTFACAGDNPGIAHYHWSISPTGNSLCASILPVFSPPKLS